MIKFQMCICNTSGIAQSVVTRIQAGQYCIRFTEQAREYWSSNKVYSVGGGVKHWGIKLSTHPHLVLRLRMKWVIPLLPYMPSWHGKGPLYIHKESKPTCCTILLFYYFLFL